MAQEDVDGIDFVDEAESDYFTEARSGIDTMEFLRSPTGVLLHTRAKIVIEKAKNELLDLDIYHEEDRKLYQAIKNEANQARWFMKWCADAIEAGNAAEVQLEEYRN